MYAYPAPLVIETTSKTWDPHSEKRSQLQVHPCRLEAPIYRQLTCHGFKAVTESNHEFGVSDDFCSDLFSLDYVEL